MGERFNAIEDDQIVVRLFPSERALLADVLTMLSSVDSDDPGYSRLHVPVYLGDEEASKEWRRLMGDELDSARLEDRRVFSEVVATDKSEIVLDLDQAESLLRVVNEGRLVLAARLGIDVEEDFAGLSPETEMALWFLSFIINDLSEELSRRLSDPATDDGSV